MGVSNMTLVKFAAIGGFATAIMGFAARDKMQSKVKAAPFYKEAMKLVRSHPGAVHLLGEPIKEGNIDVAKDDLNFIKGNQAQFKVPLKGPKQRGSAYLTANKGDGEEQWTLSQIELEVADHPNKRLVIKSSSST